jgi:uncharacterized protein involved in exopolysaccharide biosynthesis
VRVNPVETIHDLEAADREKVRPEKYEPQPGVSDDLSGMDAFVTIVRDRKLVGAITLFALLASIIYLIFAPNIYTGAAKIMPPQQNQSLSSMFSQLGPLASLAGRDTGLKSASDLYISLLQSRTVADSLIERFKLRELYDVKRMGDARRELEGRTRISAAKSGVISIEVDDRDPQRAADLSNAYIEELRKLNNTLAIGEAAQRRLFLEGQLQKAKENLANAEVELKKSEEKSGLIQPDVQSRALIASMSQLEAAVAAKEVELSSLKTFATEQNPDLFRAQQELAGLREQLNKLRKSSSSDPMSLQTSRLPEVGLEYIRRFRDVKYFETLFEMIARQYETAKIDEAKSGSVIQVLDPAVPPERRSKPLRSVILLLSFIAGLVVALFFVLAREVWRRKLTSPLNTERTKLLYSYLGR